jgi:hypothetical protein
VWFCKLSETCLDCILTDELISQGRRCAKAANREKSLIHRCGPGAEFQERFRGLQTIRISC